MRIKAWILSLLSTALGPAPVTLPEADLGTAPPTADESYPSIEERVAAGASGGASPLAARALMPAFDRAIAEYAAARLNDPSLETSEALAYWLERLPEWARTYTICEWALSDREPLHRALTSPTLHTLHIVGLRSALEHLTSDASAETRERAQAALLVLDRLDLEQLNAKAVDLDAKGSDATNRNGFDA